jgi:hypothetical protein
MKFVYGFLITAYSIVLASCAFRSADQVVDRKFTPQVVTGVPANVSEVRELKFNKVVGESSHKDLHVRGRIFSKSEAGGVTEIKPCSGCMVVLQGLKDTSVHVRITSEPDGYFSFHGEHTSYGLMSSNPGLNTVVLDQVDFDAGGVTSIILVNATGEATERFRVTKNERTFTLTKE